MYIEFQEHTRNSDIRKKTQIKDKPYATQKIKWILEEKEDQA